MLEDLDSHELQIPSHAHRVCIPVRTGLLLAGYHKLYIYKQNFMYNTVFYLAIVVLDYPKLYQVI
jgi:hypothetical protein